MNGFAFALIVLGGLGIGAWLVVQGHPWFALLVIAIVASARLGGGSFDSDSGEADG